ncbi:phosphotransferase [Candidatus Pelagibacter sp.]|uniref:phosphotransferase n=1 Tax=Candidatus Pelagibacter sp. TaxID=2024849 RepID=UPI003F8527AA
MSLKEYRLKKIKGDASFRQFYRKSFYKKNSIIVYADKEKEKNLLVYDCINKILNKNNVKAPKLINENYELNYIEIEDLGEKTMFNFLKNNSKDLKYFRQAIDLLLKIQKIKDRKIKNFKGKTYNISEYNKKTLFEEAELFCKWYVPSNLNKNKKDLFNKKIKGEIKKLISKLKLKNDTFVHRDFHVSNIILNKDRTSLIDSQDALIGNQAYDLASIIDDVRFKTSITTKNKIFDYFLKKNKKINFFYLKNDFEILSVLRNLKIIGIFTRLAVRDKKYNYLKMIPYAWKLIELRVKQNIHLKMLNKLLSDNFPKQIK